MPSIAVQSARATVSAATSKGVLTVDSNAYIFPGANAWLYKADGTLQYRVKILYVAGTTTVVVRRWPSKMEADGTSHDQENYGAPRYGLSDVSAMNGVTAYLSMEAQSVPVDPTYSKRVVP